MFTIRLVNELIDSFKQFNVAQQIKVFDFHKNYTFLLHIIKCMKMQMTPLKLAF